MTHRFWSISVLIIIIFFVPISFVDAAAIGIYGTGLDNSGQLLSPSTIDPHYIITAAPPGFSNSIGPIVATNKPSSWANNTSTSQWINPTGNAGESLLPGYYVYQTSFDLTGLDPTTASIDGSWGVDDACDIYLNGRYTGFSLTYTPDDPFPYNILHSFRLSTGFISTINYLTFFAYNANRGNTPTGLQVQISSATAAPVPNPSIFVWKGGNDDTKTAWGVTGNWDADCVPDIAGIKVIFGEQPLTNNMVDLVSVGRTIGNIAFYPTTSTIIQSSGGFALTLNNNGSVSTVEVAGNHTISAPVVINNDATIIGAGTLNLTGGISGNHTLAVLGNLTAKSIQVDTLNIGHVGSQAVPEPSILAMLLSVVVGCIAPVAYGWRRIQKTV